MGLADPACQYLESFHDNISKGRWGPAASDALHLYDIIVSLVLEASGTALPRSHRGRLRFISLVDRELASAYSELLSLYARMSYEGLDGGLASRLRDLVDLALRRAERHGVALPCV